MLTAYRATGVDERTNESLAVEPNSRCELYIVNDLLPPNPRVFKWIQDQGARNVPSTHRKSKGSNQL